MTALRCLLLATLLPVSISQPPLCDSDGSVLLQRHRHSASSSASGKPDSEPAGSAGAVAKDSAGTGVRGEVSDFDKAIEHVGSASYATTSLAPGQQLSDLDKLHESESEKQALEAAKAKASSEAAIDGDKAKAKSEAKAKAAAKDTGSDDDEVTNVLKVNVVDSDGEGSQVLKIRLPENLTATVESTGEGADQNVSASKDVMKSAADVVDAASDAANAIANEVHKYTGVVTPANVTDIADAKVVRVAPNPKWLEEDNNNMAAVLLLMVILVLLIIVGVLYWPFTVRQDAS